MKIVARLFRNQVIEQYAEIGFWQLSYKPLTFGYENELLIPHNVATPHILMFLGCIARNGKCVTNQILFLDLQLVDSWRV